MKVVYCYLVVDFFLIFVGEKGLGCIIKKFLYFKDIIFY